MSTQVIGIIPAPTLPATPAEHGAARDVCAGNPMSLRIGLTTYTANSSMESASAKWDGRHFEAKSRNGALCALARKLKDAGCPDLPWQALNGDRVSVYGPSLHGLASWTYSETDRGLKRVKWSPFNRETQP